MAGSFASAWGLTDERLPKLSLKDRLKLLIRGKAKLRQKVVEAVRTLERDIRHLNATLGRYESMRRSLEIELKKAVRGGEEDRAKALANSLAAVLQYRKLVFTMKLCFELMAARLKIVLEVGDAMNQIGPLLKMLKVVAPLVANFMPTLGESIEQVQDTLVELVQEMDLTFTSVTPMELESPEAANLLEAVKMSVEQEADLELPELPELGARRTASLMRERLGRG